MVKSGPFASSAAAAAGTPLIGQTPGTFLPDASTVWYKLVVTNTNASLPLLLGNVTDTNFFAFGVNATPASGFLHTGTTLASWGITCTPSGTAACHESRHHADPERLQPRPVARLRSRRCTAAARRWLSGRWRA